MKGKRRGTEGGRSVEGAPGCQAREANLTHGGVITSPPQTTPKCRLAECPLQTFRGRRKWVASSRPAIQTFQRWSPNSQLHQQRLAPEQSIGLSFSLPFPRSSRALVPSGPRLLPESAWNQNQVGPSSKCGSRFHHSPEHLEGPRRGGGPGKMP